MNLIQKLGTAGFALAVLLQAGCSSPQKGKVLERVVSPDSKVDAYLMLFTGSATEADAFVVELVRHGQPAPTSSKTEEFVADNVDGLRISWSSPTVLDISFDAARIFRFANFNNSLFSGRPTIELRLRPTKEHAFTNSF
jgi:hypothetical protein